MAVQDEMSSLYKKRVAVGGNGKAITCLEQNSKRHEYEDGRDGDEDGIIDEKTYHRVSLARIRLAMCMYHVWCTKLEIDRPA